MASSSSEAVLSSQNSGRNRIFNALQGRWVFLALGLVLGLTAAWLIEFAEAPKADGVQNALALENRSLAAGEMQDAYDALLAAMRIAPGDDRVFAASLEFVQQAVRTNNDDSLALAEDIHQRAANLIPFLPLSRLKSARAEHAELAKSLFPTKPPTKPDDPLAEADALLKAALDAQLPTFVRSRLVHDAELELGNQGSRAAVLQKRPDQQRHFWARWGSAKSRYDEAQSALLTNLYRENCQPRVGAWLKQATDLKAQATQESPQPTDQQSKRILELVTEGQRLERELSTYVEGGVEPATTDAKRDELNKQIVQLSQLREWNYNRWALVEVEQVEESGTKGLDSLKILANIEESRLSAYVGQRLSEVWKKNFDECSKDDKVTATQLKILREYQQ
jgi:hypothetical protein